MFWTSMLSYWQAIALARPNGLTAADILPHADDTANSLTPFFAFCTDRIDAGEHTGDDDRLAMGMASVEHVLRTSADAGVHTVLPAAVVGLFQRGTEEGHATDDRSGHGRSGRAGWSLPTVNGKGRRDRVAGTTERGHGVHRVPSR
ncbi:hypothetical protein [Streptomyces microflavus]|uniref:imine reductase family protein n=1 Tax=Streptomyces microflavus TaxID=1919 RepID=UPI00368F4364